MWIENGNSFLEKNLHVLSVMYESLVAYPSTQNDYYMIFITRLPVLYYYGLFHEIIRYDLI